MCDLVQHDRERRARRRPRCKKQKCGYYFGARGRGPLARGFFVAGRLPVRRERLNLRGEGLAVLFGRVSNSWRSGARSSRGCSLPRRRRSFRTVSNPTFGSVARARRAAGPSASSARRSLTAWLTLPKTLCCGSAASFVLDIHAPARPSLDTHARVCGVGATGWVGPTGQVCRSGATGDRAAHASSRQRSRTNPSLASGSVRGTACRAPT
jgi:hypothetical protein